MLSPVTFALSAAIQLMNGYRHREGISHTVIGRLGWSHCINYYFVCSGRIGDHIGDRGTCLSDNALSGYIRVIGS